MLILWSKNGDFVYASNIPENASTEENLTWNWQRFSAPGVQLVAGGGGLIAVVSKVFLAFALLCLLHADLRSDSTPRDINSRS
jgi:hypothetical protein